MPEDLYPYLPVLKKPISVKWLHKGHWRRFQLPESQWTYECLYQTLQQLEPGFAHFLLYRDIEDDTKYVFWTDVEMRAMLAYFHDVLKMDEVQIESFEPDGSEGFPQPLIEAVKPKIDKQMDSQKKKIVHTSIICDGCNMDPLCGTRFKCMICLDFDICEDCEKAGMHSHHAMARIPAPEIMKQYAAVCSNSRNIRLEMFAPQEAPPAYQSGSDAVIPKTAESNNVFNKPPDYSAQNNDNVKAQKSSAVEREKPKESKKSSGHVHRSDGTSNLYSSHKHCWSPFMKREHHSRSFPHFSQAQSFYPASGFPLPQNKFPGGFRSPFNLETVDEAMRRQQRASEQAQLAFERLFSKNQDRYQKFHEKMQRKVEKVQSSLQKASQKAEKRSSNVVRKMKASKADVPSMEGLQIGEKRSAGHKSKLEKESCKKSQKQQIVQPFENIVPETSAQTRAEYNNRLASLKSTARDFQMAFKNFGIECDATIEDNEGKVHHEMPSLSREKECNELEKRAQKSKSMPLKDSLMEPSDIVGKDKGSEGVRQRAEISYAILKHQQEQLLKNVMERCKNSTQPSAPPEVPQRDSSAPCVLSMSQYPPRADSYCPPPKSDCNAPEAEIITPAEGQREGELDSGNAEASSQQDPLLTAVLDGLMLIQRGASAAVSAIQDANISQLFNLDPSAHPQTQRIENELKTGAQTIAKFIDDTTGKLLHEITESAAEGPLTTDQIVSNLVDGIGRSFYPTSNSTTERQSSNSEQLIGEHSATNIAPSDSANDENGSKNTQINEPQLAVQHEHMQNHAIDEGVVEKENVSFESSSSVSSLNRSFSTLSIASSGCDSSSDDSVEVLDAIESGAEYVDNADDCGDRKEVSIDKSIEIDITPYESQLFPGDNKLEALLKANQTESVKIDVVAHENQRDIHGTKRKLSVNEGDEDSEDLMVFSMVTDNSAQSQALAQSQQNQNTFVAPYLQGKGRKSPRKSESGDSISSSSSAFSDLGNGKVLKKQGDEWMVVSRSNYRELCEFYAKSKIEAEEENAKREMIAEQQSIEQIEQALELTRRELQSIALRAAENEQQSQQAVLTNVSNSQSTAPYELVNHIGNLNNSSRTLEEVLYGRDQEANNIQSLSEQIDACQQTNEIGYVKTQQIDNDVIHLSNQNQTEVINVQQSPENNIQQYAQQQQQQAIEIMSLTPSSSSELTYLELMSSQQQNAHPLAANIYPSTELMKLHSVPKSPSTTVLAAADEIIVRDEETTGRKNLEVEDNRCMAGVPFHGINPFHTYGHPHQRHCHYVHDDIGVQSAVDTLVFDMGFDNCNGWLTSLALQYRGDIERILEEAEKDPFYMARLKRSEHLAEESN